MPQEAPQSFGAETVEFLVAGHAGSTPRPLAKVASGGELSRLALAIAAAATPFVVWDLWATHVGHWRFDPDQTLPWRVAGLPLEEIGFFVVIPLASVLTYEAVRAVGRRDRSDRSRPRRPERSREDA